MTMAVEEFVRAYIPGPDTAVAFAWNGKHAAEFVDANDTFRSEVATFCIANPESASAPLLADLLIADAKWSTQAWSVPDRFPELAALLLIKAGPAALPVFQKCAFASFDTYGACHQMRLPVSTAQSLMATINEKVKEATDEKDKQQLQSLLELLSGIAAGTATDGWVKVAGGASSAAPTKRRQSFWSWVLSWFR